MPNEHHQTSKGATDETGPAPGGEPLALSMKRGYEVGDVRLKWVLWATAIFVVFTIVTFIFLWFLWKLELRRNAADDVQRSIVAADNQDYTSAPPLQPNTRHDFSPAEDLKKMYANENALLDSIGWTVDPSTNLPKVPDAVVKQVAERRK